MRHRRFNPRATARRIMMSDNFNMTTGADVETIRDFMTCVDAPSSLSNVETGSVVKGFSLEVALMAPPASSKIQILLFKDNGALQIVSTTPILDYLATTLPMTAIMQDIRKAALAFRTCYTGSVQDWPLVCKFRLRRPIRFNEADRLRFAIRSSVSTVVNCNVLGQGVCYK